MAKGSFFTQDGYSSTTISTFQELVQQALEDAGAIGPKSVAVENPSGADNITLFYVNAAATVKQITASVKGTSPSINADIQYASSPSGVGTSLVTGGVTVTSQTITTSFDNALIPANSYVRLVTSSMTGTVDELAISLDF